MLSGFVLLTLAVPFQPVLETPLPEGWSPGTGGEFVTSNYQDDAGVAAASMRLDFRREDAGYGALQETFLGANRYVHPTIAFPTEGDRYCWRAVHLNARGQSSPPSDERCFRTDWTPPTSPAFVDAGIILSNGRVAIEVQPATDALSGVRGYFLEVAPTPLGEFYEYPFTETALPIDEFLGDGTWFAWVRVMDVAGNDNTPMRAEYTVPIHINASNAVPVPEAPRFVDTMVNGYGSALDWDAGWMEDAGVTHVVASFCFLSDGGCTQWRHGFHTVPVSAGPGVWLQVSDEGMAIARLAVVKGGQVGPWSPPSPILLVDRTPPPVPPGLTAFPPLSRAGPITLRWGAVVDDLTGLGATVIEETELISGTTRSLSAPTPGLSLTVTPGDGVFRYRAQSVDRVENQSAWSNTADAVVDAKGPISQAPTAQASLVDGGALVSLSWALPMDLLSGVASEELEERNGDGGTQLVAVTGLGASRFVGPGAWKWALRGTDVAGNVGPFGPGSNTIVVTASGVAVGPAISTTDLSARCGEPLSLTLQGSGDAPLHWMLDSGPAGLTVDAAGQLSWTPPAGKAGVEVAQVQLFNDVAQATGSVTLTVSCAEAPDGGSPPAPPFRRLGIGCGCSSLEGALILLALGLLRRR